MDKENKELESIQHCLNLVEQKLNWGDSSSWHSQVFEELSHLIQNETGVLLSSTTLKRVWGKVNYQNSPSISTLNALAQFIGYKNWREFISQQHSPTPTNQSNSKWSGLLWLSPLALFSIVFLLGYYFNAFNLNRNADVAFKSNVISKGLPNSVLFEFDVSELNADSIWIQQFWDPSKSFGLLKEQSKATGIYYYPGHYKAKLIADNRIYAQHDLFIPSEGWLATIDYEPIPKYYKLPQSVSILNIDSLVKSEISSLEKPVVSSFHWVGDLDSIPLNQVHLQCKVRNTLQEKWAICKTLKIVLLGTEGVVYIPFSLKGCVSDLNYVVGKTYLNGKKHDLSSFGVDLRDTNKIDINLDDQNILIKVQDKVIFEDQFEGELGNLVGIRFRFLGLGEVLGLNVRSNNKEVEELCFRPI